ncbi:AAA family ATPase [Aminobacter carboxidus]|uniref:ATP-binding protein n=1 Tax=Aminobacter carboxidus TaxID=376165 RepID=A0ABR9GXG7_9HYPH|nr:ATP-binding protein [Aminobacter carboxidus]MBE1208381.1 ATP-binding protein [Aminobacter carboxidus]
MTTQFAITAVDVDLPKLGPQRLRFTDHADAMSRSTILVGRNGTGKSTILRELAMAFRAYFATMKPSSRQGRDRVDLIAISVNEQHAVLSLRSSSKEFREEREVITGRGLKPRRLIALSFTPFDKFPPADDTYRRDRPLVEDPFYVYLGFKNDYRSLSPRGRLLRSIDQLAFAESTPQADKRVVEAFAAIGYDPVIKITYELDTARVRRSGYMDEAQMVALEKRIEEFARASGIKRKQLSYRFDFRYGRRDVTLPISFEEIRDLTRSGLFRLVSVTLDRVEGEPVELLELSSGELNLLSGFLGLAAFLEDGCLILIDEPENSLHPEWQIRYVEMLETVLRQHQGCHYVIATHSPLIVSGVADRNAKVLRLDQHPIEVPSEVLANASPDATLLNAFHTVTKGNNFLKQLVLEALTLVETGEHHSSRALDIANFLASKVEQIPHEDPLRELTANVIQALLLPR